MRLLGCPSKGRILTLRRQPYIPGTDVGREVLIQRHEGVTNLATTFARLGISNNRHMVQLLFPVKQSLPFNCLANLVC